jgi:hypothetical protein
MVSSWRNNERQKEKIGHFIMKSHHDTQGLEALRKKIWADKAEYRSYLAKAPVEEKLRILEEMRDFTAAMQQARDENKARMKHAWSESANLS